MSNIRHLQPDPRNVAQQTEELKITVREAHEVLKDLRHAEKMVRSLVREVNMIIEEDTYAVIQAHIDAAAPKIADGLTEAVAKQINETADKVTARFVKQELDALFRTIHEHIYKTVDDLMEVEVPKSIAAQVYSIRVKDLTTGTIESINGE